MRRVLILLFLAAAAIAATAISAGADTICHCF